MYFLIVLMITTTKVFAYIVRSDGRFLVFDQPDFPEAGVQVTKGTVEVGESLEDALFREVEEETGFKKRDVVHWEYMGERVVDMSLYDVDEQQVRHFYVVYLGRNVELQETWEMTEKHKTLGSVRYRLFWHVRDDMKRLSFGHGDLVDQVPLKFDFYCAVALKSKSQLDIVYEDEYVLAFHHTRPSFKDHIVVIPKVHELDASTASDQMLVHVWGVASRIAGEMKERLGTARIVSNLGEYQDTPHFHVHVVSYKL